MVSISNEYDYLFKIVLVGDAGVGKSSLLLRFADEIFNSSYINTIGVDFRIRSIEVDGKKVKLQIWDTAGQERFRNITASFYRGSHGIILAFELINKDTFDRLDRWMAEVSSCSDVNVAKLLVGTKCDETLRREVNYDTARDYANERGLQYVESSAKTNVNVDQIFDFLSKEILNRIEIGMLTSTHSERVRPVNANDRIVSPVNKDKACC